MSRCLTWFHNTGLRNKILVCFLSLIFVSLILVGALYDYTFCTAMSKLTNNTSAVILTQAKATLTEYIESIDRVIYSLSDDTNVRAFCNGEEISTDESDAPYVRIQIQKSLAAFQKTYPEIMSITVVSLEDKFVSSGMYRTKNTSLLRERWLMECIAQPEKLHFEAKPAGRNLSYNEIVSTDEILCMTRAISDKHGNIIGAILIDTRIEKVNEFFRYTIPGKDGFVVILDRNGDVIYAPTNPIAARIRPNWFTEYGGNFTKSILDNRYQLIYDIQDTYDWKIVSVVALDDILQPIYHNRYVLFATIIGAFFITILISYALASTIVTPLKKLVRLMENSTDGVLNVRFHVLYNDEIGLLGRTFNTMLLKIGELMHRVQAEEKEKRHAEMRVLQEQIKPHFLYNTLDTIHWMARKYRADDIVYLVHCLTSFFRIGLSGGSEIICLRDEISHAENYLRIQQVRYEDILTYSIEVDEQAEDLSIHKILIQPLIENALYHGIKPLGAGGHIRLVVQREGEKLVIRVIDNGIGMSDQMVDELNEMFRGNKSSYGGYGLYNINERVKLAYGADYGLHIAKGKEKGVVVTLEYPVLDTNCPNVTENAWKEDNYDIQGPDCGG